MKKNIKFFITFLSFFSILVCWQIFSVVINSELILPSPKLVLISIMQIINTKIFWINFCFTLHRIIVAFFISVSIGFFIGCLCGLNEYVNVFFKFPISIIRTTPVIAFILIALFWFKSSTIPIFVSILMTLPIICTSVANGFFSVDKKLIQMAKLYKISFFQQFIKIKMHFVLPYFLSGIKSAFGLTWKVVVAGEIISLPKKAIGTVLSQAQVHLETQKVIAYTILIVFFSFIIESLFGVLLRIIKSKNGIN